MRERVREHAGRPVTGSTVTGSPGDLPRVRVHATPKISGLQAAGLGVDADLPLLSDFFSLFFSLPDELDESVDEDLAEDEESLEPDEPELLLEDELRLSFR